MKQLSPVELSEWMADDSRSKPVLLDVRETWEFQLCHIAGSVHIPMATIPARIGELDPDAEIVVICHHGGRSAQVGIFLERQGFPRVINLAEGVAGWAARVEPGMPQY